MIKLLISTFKKKIYQINQTNKLLKSRSPDFKQFLWKENWHRFRFGLLDWEMIGLAGKS